MTASRPATRLVLRRAGDDERGAGAHDDGRQRAGQQRGTAHHAGRQPVPADDGVLVGEERDLRVAGAEQPRGQPGEPVEGGVAVDLEQQPAGGGDAVRIVQDVRLRRARTGHRRHVLPLRADRAAPARRRVPSMLSCGRRVPATICSSRARQRPARRRVAGAPRPGVSAARRGSSEGRPRADVLSMLRHADAGTAGLPSAARRPRRADAGLPADRRPRRRDGRRLRGAGPVPRHRRARRVVRRRGRGRRWPPSWRRSPSTRRWPPSPTCPPTRS